MFRILSISEQPPPGFAPDWLVAYVDPSGISSRTAASRRRAGE
jgi:hypothetical protein